MAFRTRRQNRYAKLRDAGFLPFEARALSKVPLKGVPWMKKMIRERYQLYKKAKQEKTSQKAWERQIKQIYIEEDFMFLGAGKWRAEYDPWQMLRSYEDKYKAKQPQYESPWKKRRKGWKDFIAKYERTVKKQSAKK